MRLVDLQGIFQSATGISLFVKSRTKQSGTAKKSDLFPLSAKECQKMTQMLRVIESETNWEERQGSPRG